MRFFLTGSLAALFLSLTLFSGASARAHSIVKAEIDLSDAPMFSRIVAPPANIMFLLDDSGSMDFEVLVKGGYSGMFPNPQKGNPWNEFGFGFVFPYNGDNYASNSDWYPDDEGKKLWKLRWHLVNVMYYNPNLTYSPWPDYGKTNFKDADPDFPRSDPVLNPSITLDLDGLYAAGGANGLLKIPNAHYYVYSAKANRPYLVALDGGKKEIRYYAATLGGIGTGLFEKVDDLSEDKNPPADVVTGRTYKAERQNFANWYTYARRREFVVKPALAKVIRGFANVRIGFYGINQTLTVPLKPVQVQAGSKIEDMTDELIGELYSYSSTGGTPLKAGLDAVGKYFEANDGNLGGKSGPKPYYDSAESGACQQSFTVIITDGYYSDNDYSASAGNADGDNKFPYADDYANTLADIAMYYYETDLSASLDNKVPANKFDDANHQHMATYAISFGVYGTLNPGDYDEKFHRKSDGAPIAWPKVPAAYLPETIDDLWHATVNGHGRFYNADDPKQLVDSLNELMDAIAKISLASSASVTVNGDALYGKIGPNTFLYQGTYRNADDEWTGDVRALRLDPVTGEILYKDGKNWSAATGLEKKGADKRLIATYNGSSGISFDLGSLTAGQKAALGKDPDKKVKYLRGEAVAGYRVRSQKLGDIVHSAPVFEDSVIYCGANDGMLHAFSAADGAEIFAYVPNLVFDNLKLLADPAYSHRFYVDLTPTVKTAKGLLGGGAQKTLLVGGLRKGGKGYFALDVTDAKTIQDEKTLAGRVLWEFPKTGDPDMGYSFSKPIIVRSNSSTYPWVVIFGNGYNSAGGKSALYVVNPVNGDLIKKIEAGAGPDNGLSSPIAVDVTYDGKADFIYAGDLQGQLWKFDLTGSMVKDWTVAYNDKGSAQPLFRARGPYDSLQPITTRPDIMFHPQGHGMLVCFGTGKYLGDSDVKEATVQSIYAVWDYGDRVYRLKAKAWSQDDDTEYLGTFISRSSAPNLSNQPATVKLLKQSYKDYSLKIGGRDVRVRVLSAEKPVWDLMPDPDNATYQEPDPSKNKVNDAGYYIDLPAGERVISDVLIRDGNLVLIGFAPSHDPCEPGGRSMFMEINAFTGGSLAGALFDITADGKIDAHDLVKVDFDGDGKLKDMPPAGLQFDGNIQPPAILGFGSAGNVEGKYMSSTSGAVEFLREKPPKLGVTYWMEIRY